MRFRSHFLFFVERDFLSLACANIRVVCVDQVYYCTALPHQKSLCSCISVGVSSLGLSCSLTPAGRKAMDALQ
jgi:hypothetical protein